MAKTTQQVDSDGNPIKGKPDYSNLHSVSDVIKAKDVGEINYRLEDVQNRPLILSEASIEVGTYGSYARIIFYDPATEEEKVVTSGTTIILAQIGGLINNNALPCRCTVRKLGKSWTLS